MPDGSSCFRTDVVRRKNDADLGSQGVLLFLLTERPRRTRRMGSITLSAPVHDRVRLLGRAWGVDDHQVVERLLNEFQDSPSRDRDEAPRNDGGSIPIHAIYEGTRVDASFDPATHSVRITSGRQTGETWRSPSGAAVGVVRFINPTLRSPERNGWNFWTVTETGEPLQSLRSR
jgi:hypothetical protein